MLGPGRPFLVEVQNARQVPSELSVRDIEKTINSMKNKLVMLQLNWLHFYVSYLCHDDEIHNIMFLQVRVKNLKLVGSHGWDLMREGEAEKQVLHFVS